MKTLFSPEARRRYDSLERQERNAERNFGQIAPAQFSACAILRPFQAFAQKDCPM
jgi:hypothetical protein